MSYRCSRASGMAQLVKNPPAMQETAFNARDLVQSLGQEDPLGKGMATHASILTWKIPEEADGLQCIR